DIPNRIDRCAAVMNVALLTTAHHLHDGVDFADVVQELVAQSFACARTFYQSGDIEKLDRRRHDLLRMRNRGDFFETRIWHADYAEIRIDCAEGIIFRWRLVRARDRVEKGRFTDVRQSNNSGAQHDILCSGGL